MPDFGWSLPAGVTTLPGEEAYHCPVCGKIISDASEEVWPEGLEGQEEVCSVRCAMAKADGYAKRIDEHGNPTKDWINEEGKDATDPYGHLIWSVGTDDDFICFDHCRIGNFMVLEAVVNSETGSFIDTFAYEEVDLADAEATAIGMVDNAWGWVGGNDIVMTRGEWKECERLAAEWIQAVKESAEEK
jgi:hypothetical protein